MSITNSKLKQIFLSLFTAALLLTFVINGCTGGEKQEIKTFKIGYIQRPGFDVALYAQEAGFFAKRGLEVEFIPFKHLPDASQAVLEGSLDAAFAALSEASQLEQSDESPVVVLVTNISYGSDGIVAQKDIQSVKDLKGKKIGCKLKTVNELTLLEALKLYNLNLKDVEIDNILKEIGVQRMKEGSLDAAVTWEPILSNTAKELEGNVIFTTKDVDSLIIDTLITRSSFLSNGQKELTQFILAWFDVMNAIEKEPEKVFATVAAQLGQSPESFAQDFAGLKIGTRAMQKRMFRTGGRLEKAKKAIIQLLKENQQFKTRSIREDIEINAEPLNAALRAWKPL